MKINEIHLLPPQGENFSQLRKTLVLDIDETLIHSSFCKSANTQFSFYIEKNSKQYEIFVSVRPGVNEFLKEMSKHYEIVTFTASQQQYCDNILQVLDPEKQLISHRLYRNHCILYQGAMIKDIRRLGRDMKNIIIIDNNPDSYLFSQENGYEISSYIDDDNDRELTNLIPFLLQIKELNDVREVELWKLKYDDLQKKSMENQSTGYIASENILEDDDDDTLIQDHMLKLQENYSLNIHEKDQYFAKIIENDFCPLQKEKPKLVKLPKSNLLNTPEIAKRRLSFETDSNQQFKQMNLLRKYYEPLQNNSQSEKLRG